MRTWTIILTRFKTCLIRETLESLTNGTVVLFTKDLSKVVRGSKTDAYKKLSYKYLAHKAPSRNSIDVTKAKCSI